MTEVAVPPLASPLRGLIGLSYTVFLRQPHGRWREPEYWKASARLTDQAPFWSEAINLFLSRRTFDWYYWIAVRVPDGRWLKFPFHAEGYGCVDGQGYMDWIGHDLRPTEATAKEIVEGTGYCLISPSQGDITVRFWNTGRAI